MKIKVTAVPIDLEGGAHGNSDLQQLLCPVCEDGYVHQSKNAYNEKGNDNYETTGKLVRGDVYAVPFQGECGHPFEVCFGFHKGFTFVWTRPPPR